MASFRTSGFRGDRLLTLFVSEDAEKSALLRAICSNSATGYVRASQTGVLVPNHAAVAVADHLRRRGWEG